MGEWKNYLLSILWLDFWIYILFESVERKHNISPNIFFRSNEQKWPSNVTSTTTFYICLIYDSPHFECNIQWKSYFSFARLSFRDAFHAHIFLRLWKKSSILFLFTKHIFYHQLIHWKVPFEGDFFSLVDMGNFTLNL